MAFYLPNFFHANIFHVWYQNTIMASLLVYFCCFNGYDLMVTHLIIYKPLIFSVWLGLIVAWIVLVYYFHFNWLLSEDGGSWMIVDDQFIPHQDWSCYIYFCGYHGYLRINIAYYNSAWRLLAISCFACYTQLQHLLIVNFLFAH